jgi:hypothetical protein
MLALFSIASGPDEHRLLFPTGEWWDFFFRDACTLESGRDLHLLKLPMQPLHPYKLGDEFMRTNQPNRVSMEQLTKADELTLQM